MKGRIFDRERGELRLGDRRLVVHCHHYNVFLQRSLEDALGAAAVTIQREAACEASRLLLSSLFDEEGLGHFDLCMVRAASIYSELGFGSANFLLITERLVEVAIKPSHYTVGWELKWGSVDRPIEHWTDGYFRGAVCAAGRFAPERVCSTTRSEAGTSPDRTTVIQVEVR